MDITLKEWLQQAPLPEDILPLPWNLSVSYMPIDVIRNKMAFMEKEFDVIINCVDVSVSAINTHDKDTCFMGTVKYTLTHDVFHGTKTICGAASFLRGQYPSGWAFSQIAESLATTRAFSKEWKQFGKGLNKEDELTKFNSPKNYKPVDNLDNALKSFNHRK